MGRATAAMKDAQCRESKLSFLIIGSVESNHAISLVSVLLRRRSMPRIEALTFDHWF